MFQRIFACFMSLLTAFTALFPNLFGSANRQPAETSDIRPDTWAAVDGLGRTLPPVSVAIPYDSRQSFPSTSWPAAARNDSKTER